MKVRSFAEARSILEDYTPLPRAARTASSLETMRQLTKLLGDPQEDYKVIHVTGTSGKTSTSYYTAAMLAATGKKVGLTVSPHMVEVNERIQLNLVPLEEGKYCKYFGEFIDLVRRSDVRPVYFELLMAFAFWVFAQEKVDYAVVEVGSGGLLDATNVIQRHDKVCVITDIGLDHTETLGKTIPEITAQKAGIIHATNKVVMYDQGDEVMDVVREVAEQQHADLHEIWPLKPRELPSGLPLFQQRNWYLAWSVSRMAIEDDDLPMLSAADLAETSKIHIPGRMEIVERGGKTIVLDGAHNGQKLHALADSLRRYFPGASFAVLLGLGHNKSTYLRSCVETVADVADYVVVTSYEVGDKLRRQSMDPARIAEQFHLMGYDAWDIIADPHEAYDAVIQRPEDVIVITGSFFMIDQLRDVFYG